MRSAVAVSTGHSGQLSSDISEWLSVQPWIFQDDHLKRFLIIYTGLVPKLHWMNLTRTRLLLVVLHEENMCISLLKPM